jgi:PAS domain S-box-containing protein
LHDCPSDEPEVVSQARLAAIVESSDDVMVSKTLDGIITSWNPAAERTLGWTAAEAIGQSIMLIVPDDRRTEEEGVLARIRRGERVDHFETRRRTRDGRLLDMSITVSPIRDGSGRIVGASKVARDIGQRRRIEEQRAALLIREQEARREAEALNRAKDELLATVSHELRTPLNSIFGWARMIQSGELDEVGRTRAIDTIVRNASAQARLVEDLIDLSRIAAGRMRLELERVELNRAIETVRPTAHAKEIALVAALDDSLETIHGAPDRLQQVVWNLLMNSLKFTPVGGRVDVSTRRLLDSVAVVVADTGQGIPAEILPLVFEPFRQGDSSSTRSHSGLGLGLALVRRLVELHGGHVMAHSAGKDQGATFTVTLPLAAPRQLAAASESTTAAHRRALGGTRIVVVDDDQEFFELAAMVLRSGGAEVRTVSSAARAHELVMSWNPTVLITDLAMPGEDGFMLASSLRTVFTRPGNALAVVAVTAYGTPESRARAERAGFDLYLTRPIDPLYLRAAIAGVIRRVG